MKKKFLSLLLALAMCLSLSVPAWASQSFIVEPPNDSINSLPGGSSRLVMREFVRYDPSQNIRTNKCYYIGATTGENLSPYPMTVYYEYSQSDSAETTLTGTLSVTTQVSAVISKVSYETGLSLSATRSWTKGTNSGASVTLPAYSSVRIEAYVPAITTSGSLVYYAYPDSSYSSGWYEYVSISNQHIPITNETHLVTIQI